jgi:hypothetical protein
MDLNEKVTVRLDDLSLLMRECKVIVVKSAFDNYYSTTMNNSLQNLKLSKPLNDVKKTTHSEISITKINDNVAENKKKGQKVLKRPKSVKRNKNVESKNNITRGLKFF